MALLSEEFFSPEDRPSLLALCALSEVSDDGVLLPKDINTFRKCSRSGGGNRNRRQWHKQEVARRPSDAVSDGSRRLTPLTVGALVGLGLASFAVGGGGGVRGGAGAATVFLFHRG